MASTIENTSSLPLIGVSSCLLGENVRYDGGNKKDAYITQQLSTRFELVAFCPEVAIGMGIPRPPVQLVDCDGEIHALGIENPAMDVTMPLSEYANTISNELAGLGGYIFKRNSPSCGITDVKVLINNQYSLTGQGIFAGQIIQRFPELPVIDEQQLTDKILRETFINNVNHYYHRISS